MAPYKDTLILLLAFSLRIFITSAHCWMALLRVTSKYYLPSRHQQCPCSPYQGVLSWRSVTQFTVLPPICFVRTPHPERGHAQRLHTQALGSLFFWLPWPHVPKKLYTLMPTLCSGLSILLMSMDSVFTNLPTVWNIRDPNHTWGTLVVVMGLHRHGVVKWVSRPKCSFPAEVRQG